MSRQDVELVTSIYPLDPDAPSGEFDMAAMIEDPVWQQTVEEVFRPDVKIRFLTPRDGRLPLMEQDTFAGPQGLAEGWRIWMEPWDSFRIAYEDLIDAGEGMILLLVRATARMRDSGIEIPQEGAALHRVEGGKIAAISFYLDQDQARRDAGLD